MRTLIWNVTATTQTLPEVYASTEVETRWGYVVEDALSAAIANLGGFVGMQNKWAVMPISPDEELGDKQVFGGGFAVALGADGNVPWGNIVGKPTFAAVATSGQYTDLGGRPTLAPVATSGLYSDLSGRPTVASPSNAAPTPVHASASSAGSSPDASRADHAHAHGSLAGGNLHANASASAAGFMSASQFSKLEGVAASAAAVGSAAPVAVASAASAGTATSAAREDHAHAHGVHSDGSLHAVATVAAHGFMSSLDKAKLDGVAVSAAAVTALAPVALGATAAVGTETTAARADHVHTHGDQAGGSLHAAATSSAAGFMSAADKTKLDAINRTYDMLGSAQGALTVGTVVAEAQPPRAISISAFSQTNTTGRATVKLQVEGVDVTTYPKAVSAGQTIKVLVSTAGTGISYTVTAREV